MKTLRLWLVWVPVLMVASLIYWTVALGLGGMSLMEVSSLSRTEGDRSDLTIGLSLGDSDGTAAAPPHDGYEPIIVHLEESVEPEDVDDNAGCGLSGGGATAVESEHPGPVGHVY